MLNTVEHSNGTVTLLFSLLWHLPSAINHQFNSMRMVGKNSTYVCKKREQNEQQAIVNVDEYVILFLHHNSLCHFCYHNVERKE